MGKPSTKNSKVLMDSSHTAHQSYHVGSTRVSSVTAIIADNLGWNKKPLLDWTRKEALAGKDPNKIADSSAKIGTLVHARIEAHLRNAKFDSALWSPVQMRLSDKAYNSYLKWVKSEKMEVIDIEKQMVSDIFYFGGTADLICMLNNRLTIVDWKTSGGWTNAAYPEYWIQGGALIRLAYETYPDQMSWDNPDMLPDYLIMSINKDNGSITKHRNSAWGMMRYWEVFNLLLELDSFRTIMTKER